MREAIEAWELERTIAKNRFNASLEVFADEKEELGNPNDHMMRYVVAEHAIVILQTAQQEYNMNVQVRLPAVNEEGGEVDDTMSLAYLVKMKGFWRRFKAEWANAHDVSSMVGRGLFGRRRVVRKEDEEYPEPTLSQEETEKRLKLASRLEREARMLIAEANSTEFDIVWLAESYLLPPGE